MQRNITTITKQKGQGIVEYALILAFVVGIAMMLNSTSLSRSINDTFREVAIFLKGGREYADYFYDWRQSSSNELKELSNEDRLNADQLGLALIASQFLGKDAQGVLEQMGYFSNEYATGGTPQWLKDNVLNNYADTGDGWSDVLIPLSYKTVNMDDNGYIWLEANNNLNTVSFITDNQANVYQKSNTFTNSWGEQVTTTDKRSVITDRIFYSNDMIKQDNNHTNADRTVAMKVHYAEGTGTVDQVQISVQKGKGENARTNWNSSSKTVSDLSLTVTGSSSDPKYTVNNPSN